MKVNHSPTRAPSLDEVHAPRATPTPTRLFTDGRDRGHAAGARWLRGRR